jgi:hypothetical protein
MPGTIASSSEPASNATAMLVMSSGVIKSCQLPTV